jgi:16S rRNA (uracil1498-N3)-methyltransferase
VTLALAVLKGDRLAQACEQASEVGVARFIPLVTERTIGRLSSTRLARLRGVALAATKSSTRTVLPVVEPAIALSRLVERVPEYDRSLVAYEDEHRTGLGDVLDRTAATVLLVVGPEGGFTPGEIQLLATASVRPFSLGPRRLRAETAAVAAVSGVLQLLGDLG